LKHWKLAIKEEVDNRAAWWIKQTGLGYWDIEVNYHNEFTDPKDANAIMYVDVDWQYIRAQIHVSYSACKGMTSTEIEKCVVHELMHIILNEMREPETDHEERVATMLQKAMFWVRDAE
jgi:hypothetical protein